MVRGSSFGDFMRNNKMKCVMWTLLATMLVVVLMLAAGQRDPATNSGKPNGGKPDSGNRCSLPPVTGQCRGYFPMFYYKKDKCEEFIYGGCDGNDNRFETVEDCMKACHT